MNNVLIYNIIFILITSCLVNIPAKGMDSCPLTHLSSISQPKSLKTIAARKAVMNLFALSQNIDHTNTNSELVRTMQLWHSCPAEIIEIMHREACIQSDWKNAIITTVYALPTTTQAHYYNTQNNLLAYYHRSPNGEYTVTIVDIFNNYHVGSFKVPNMTFNEPTIVLSNRGTHLAENNLTTNFWNIVDIKKPIIQTTLTTKTAFSSPVQKCIGFTSSDHAIVLNNRVNHITIQGDLSHEPVLQSLNSAFSQLKSLSACISPDGTQYAILDASEHIHFYKFTKPYPDGISIAAQGAQYRAGKNKSMLFSPDGSHFIYSYYDRSNHTDALELLKFQENSIIKQAKIAIDPASILQNFAISFDNKTLALATKQRQSKPEITFFRIRKNADAYGEQLGSFEHIHALHFLPNGALLAIDSNNVITIEQNPLDSIIQTLTEKVESRNHYE